MKNLSIIVAFARNGAIGKNNDLLWHISADLKRFKQFTTGNTIIMGRKTFESLPNGPLPDREHIILTRNKTFHPPGCIVAESVDEAIKQCNTEKENFIIGGGEIYSLFLPFCSKIYLTRIDKDFKADTFFPKINADVWQIDSESDKYIDEKSGINYQYVTYIRKD